MLRCPSYSRGLCNRADTWTRGTDMLYDAYGMGCSAANGQQQVVGGIRFGEWQAAARASEGSYSRLSLDSPARPDPVRARATLAHDRRRVTKFAEVPRNALSPQSWMHNSQPLVSHLFLAEFLSCATGPSVVYWECAFPLPTRS